MSRDRAGGYLSFFFSYSLWVTCFLWARIEFHSCLTNAHPPEQVSRERRRIFMAPRDAIFASRTSHHLLPVLGRFCFLSWLQDSLPETLWICSFALEVSSLRGDLISHLHQPRGPGLFREVQLALGKEGWKEPEGSKDELFLSVFALPLPFALCVSNFTCEAMPSLPSLPSFCSLLGYSHFRPEWLTASTHLPAFRLTVPLHSLLNGSTHLSLSFSCLETFTGSLSPSGCLAIHSLHLECPSPLSFLERDSPYISSLRSHPRPL